MDPRYGKRSFSLPLSGEFESLSKRSLFESGSWLGRFRSYDGGEFGLTRERGLSRVLFEVQPFWCWGEAIELNFNCGEKF